MASPDETALVDDEKGAGSATSRKRLRLTVLGIVLLMGIALGLKAWDERQTADRNLLSSLRSDAARVAQRIDGRANTADVAIDLATRTNNASSDVSKSTPNVDAVLAISDAARSPEGSRLKDAANAAEALVEAGARVGLSAQGDVVLVSESASGTAVMAIAPAKTWLPNATKGTRLTLVGRKDAVFIGDPALGRANVAPHVRSPGYQSLGRLERAATACAPVSQSQLAVCSTVSRPLISLDDIIRMLIFVLLLSAPVLAIVGLMRQVSTQEANEIIEETREEEADRILGVVMRGANAGYWEWTQDSNKMFLSEGASSLLGMDGAGVLEMPALIEQVHPDHRVRITETLDQSRIIGWVQTNFLANVHPPRWVELRGSLTESDDDGSQVFGGIMLDVTERKKSEDRVKAAERRLRNAIEGFNGPFALWDHRKRLLYWNRAFALDFGLQDTLRPGMGHETVHMARAGAVLLERQSEVDARTNLVALQSGRWLKMVERSTPDEGLITVGIDVTENIRNEEELKKQKRRMKKAVLDLERSEGRASELSRKYSEEKAKAEHAAHTKSAFLANMSHELRTPLNAINGFSEILANELYGELGDQRYKGYARDILTSGQHLLDMINDILDMAKIEAGKMTISPQAIDPVDPVDAAVRMIRRKAEDKGIEIELDAQPRLPDIDADHRAIRQMVLNLVSNAIKFTDKDGKITVNVEQRGPDIYVGVTDTGIGIPAEDLPRLAKPFEQVSGTRDRNYEGTGLGLALTKSFAEMHGGRMGISSIEGEGTTVSFTLPISGASELVAEAKAADELNSDDITIN